MILYSLKEAVSQIRCNKYTTFSAVGIISIILLVFGLFLLSLHNLNIFTEVMKSDMEVIAFSSGHASDQTLQEIKSEIEAMKETEAVVFISKEDAMVKFAREMNSFQGVIKGLTENPLPDAFRIKIVPDARTPDDMRNLAEKLSHMEGIEDVEYGKEWVERLNALLTALKVLSLIVGSVMFLLVLFIVSNAIKLTFLMRRDEIEIMKLAGATRLFIRIPYILEGGILGLISASASVVMLYVIHNLIIYKIPSSVYLWLGGIEFSFISLKGLIAIIVTGIIAGCFGSWTSVGRLTGIALFLILCLNITNVPVVESRDLQSTEKEIRQSQQELSDVDKKIKEKKKATRKVAAEEKKVKRKLGVKEKDLGSKKKELYKVSKDIAQKKKEIKTVHQTVESLSSELDSKKMELSGFIKEIYKSNMWRYSGSAEILLSSTDYNDYKVKLKYQDMLLGEADHMMSSLSEDIRDLNNNLLSLNKRQQTLLVERGNIAEDKVIIERDIRQNRQQLVSIQRKKADYEEEIKRLTSASAALKKLIASYEKDRSKDLPAAGTGFGKNKGLLTWPLEGDVVSEFGRQKHPEFDAYVFKKGIEIAARGSKDIRAAFDGVVAYADWLQGYGLTLIIDHGNSYYSIYGHASRIKVSRGGKIRKGQVVAVAGKGNVAERDGIYFELRHLGEVVDPIAWLSKGSGG
ncbi:MAG: peptidoglycan DD-metalloendopeptidase family protein [Nitrospirae bacterium]|nr:peptidoglycan DD-metalloendopeptidase family protein [Nitrospirota bacterium]